MKKQWIGLYLAGVLACALPWQATAQTAAGKLTSGYTQTRYPIVLVHGMIGFGNIGPIDYFYGIPGALRKDGAIVQVASVSALNSTEVRGEQLLSQVKQILATTGASKVNLIGHSHGGPTVRYVASVRPDLVASVTSIAGSNKGTPMGDAIVQASAQNGAQSAIIKQGLNAFGSLITVLSGRPLLPQDAIAGARSISVSGSEKFNQEHPWGVPRSACGEGDYSARGVAYYSWSGAKQSTHLLDPSDVVLSVTAKMFGNEKNDGLVGSCSSHLGKVLRDDYNMNHLDEINHVMGLVSWTETNPVAVFRQHANRLKNADM